MRRKAKVDANQAEIVKQLRQCGYSVQSLAVLGQGVPDLLIGVRGKNVLIELKDGNKVPSARKLTPDEIEWHNKWRGQVYTAKNFVEIIQICNKL